MSTPVPVTIARSRPVPLRPSLPATLVATDEVVVVATADDLQEGAACSCAAGDDNPN